MEEKTCFGIDLSPDRVLEKLADMRLIRELYISHLEGYPLSAARDLFICDAQEQIKALTAAIESVKALQELNTEVVYVKN